MGGAYKIAEFLNIVREFSKLFKPNGDKVYQWLHNAGLNELQAQEFIKRQLEKGNIIENPSNYFQVLN